MMPEKLDELGRIPVQHYPLDPDPEGIVFCGRCAYVWPCDADLWRRREVRLREAWDAVSAAIDDTHPEGHPCDICNAADDMDDIFDEVPQ
jgi:hypothetical protein